MWTTDPGGRNGPARRRAGRFVQSGRTAFFPVPVLRTSTTGRTVSFFRIERTGPPGGVPARSLIRVHIPYTFPRDGRLAIELACLFNRVYIPLSTSPILLSLFSALPASQPAKSTS